MQMMTLISVARATREERTMFAYALSVGIVAGGLFVGLGFLLDWLTITGENESIDRFATGFVCGFVPAMLGLLTDYRR
jgi:F0F1-type ATP synthase assembly protein I